MKNKILIAFILVSLLGIITGLVISTYEDSFTTSIEDGLIEVSLEGRYSSMLLNLSALVFLITGIYLLLINGSFYRSQAFRIARLGIALSIVGVLAKIMHWPFSFQLVLAGFSAMLIAYSIHFFQKANKNVLDWGKLIFIYLFMTGRFLAMSHYAYGHEITLFAILLFIVIVLRYINRMKLEKGNSTIS